MNMTIIDTVKKQLLLHGNINEDFNLNRTIKEIIGHDLVLCGKDFEVIDKHTLNPKYKPELDDFKEWFEQHFPLYNKLEHRRHIVYFNNKDHDNRLQCISLFQIIGNTMIIYQRSSDIEKMMDDFRFFEEIRKTYFRGIEYIKIFYGSLHLKVE